MCIEVQTQGGDAARVDGEELDQNIPASIVIESVNWNKK
jgi:hypothetical protein